MVRFIVAACCLAASCVASYAPAQTVRFETTVGSFDVVLNPTGAPELQPYVEGFLQYVSAGTYEGTVINRAPEGFVVQMGSFTTDATTSATVPATGFELVPALDPVIVDADNDGQIDFDTTPFSNTYGEVAFALRSGQVNSASSSFYVNLDDNSFLDPQGFVPFARIPNMEVIELIEGLNQVDLSSQVGTPGSLAYTDVPVINGDQLVFIESLSVAPEPSTTAIAAVASILGACGSRRQTRPIR